MIPYLKNVKFPYTQGEETELSLVCTAMGDTPLTGSLLWLAESPRHDIHLFPHEAEEIRAFLQDHIPLLEKSIPPAEHDAIVQPFLTIYERLSR